MLASAEHLEISTETAAACLDDEARTHALTTIAEVAPGFFAHVEVVQRFVDEERRLCGLLFFPPCHVLYMKDMHIGQTCLVASALSCMVCHHGLFDCRVVVGKGNFQASRMWVAMYIGVFLAKVADHRLHNFEQFSCSSGRQRNCAQKSRSQNPLRSIAEPGLSQQRGLNNCVHVDT